MKTFYKILTAISLLIFCINSAQKTSIKYFENTDFKNLKDPYLYKTINLNGTKVNIDLNFDNKTPTNEDIQNLSEFLNHLTENIKACTTKLRKEFNTTSENVIKEYIDHHLSEIPKKDLARLINLQDKSKTNSRKLLEKLKLTRIGIYAQNYDQYSIFDYTIGEEFTQYLIVFTLNKNGEIVDITMES